jgi:hypothetical protein
VRKIYAALAVAVAAALCCAGLSRAATDGAGSPSIASDKADYMPGEFVVLTGDGWQPGDAVHVVLNDSGGAAWRDEADATADEDGTFGVVFRLPDTEIAAYAVTAAAANGTAATTTFTDKGGPPCCDGGGGGSGPPPDTQPPAVTLSASPNGSNGWFTRTPAVVRTTAVDSSGIASMNCTLDGGPAAISSLEPSGSTALTGTVRVTGNGFHQVACAAVDRAGNRGTSPTLTVKLDTTAPVVAVTASGPMGNAGWFVGDVTVTTTGSDDVSGPVVCDQPRYVTTDTTFDPVVGACINQAGLVTMKEVVVKRDATPPEVSFGAVSDGATYLRGNVPDVRCSTHDATSGVATEATLALTGGTVNAVGPYTATCSGATDVAGNAAAPAAAHYRVFYDGVSGILQPIKADGTSVFNRGQTVPVKLALAGDEGTSGYVTSVWSMTALGAACTGQASSEPTDVGSATPSNAFRYDASADQYIYNADFRDRSSGSCWLIRVTLDSGQVLDSAVFRVR